MGRLTAFISAVIILVFATAAAAKGPLQGPAIHERHVRVLDSDLVPMFDCGCRDSQTFKQLIDGLDSTDIIVLLDSSRSLPKGVAGTVRFVTRVPGYRYLRVTLDDRLTLTQLIALFAHELQHVYEVASAPDVIDGASLLRFYMEHGERNQVGFDTDAARSMGQAVILELESSVSPTHPPGEGQ